MSLADRGRFCGACRKIVHDMSRMTEPEARALLASSPEGLCVRYIHDARGEIVFRRPARDLVPAARLVKQAAMVAMAVTLPLASFACMGATAPPAVSPSTTTMGEPAPAQPDAGSALLPEQQPESK